jgi:type II secretory pathway pseudopilin PulG
MELVISSLLMIVLGLAMATLLKTSYDSKSIVVGQNNAYAQARNVVDTLSDRIRQAQRYPSNNQVLSAAGASDITVYTDNSGSNTVRYWLDTSTTPYTLKMTTVAAGNTTTSTLLTGVATLQFKYYVGSGNSYLAPSGSWATTASPTAPTSGELPNLGAIQVTSNVTINGFSREISSFIRLRNSPYKATL